MENNKDIGWYLDVDCASDAFSFSMDAMLALSYCLFAYLNVTLQLPSVKSIYHPSTQSCQFQIMPRLVPARNRFCHVLSVT